jgi:rhodanese-related sulfurtransferase
MGWISCAQIPANRPGVGNPKFDEKISQLISFSVPTIGVSELKNMEGEVYILDAREKEEYEISHIPNAIYIGYNKLEKKVLKTIPKDANIVLYCSVGYRSEKIGEKFQKKGFTNVRNLYGSIFEWINQGNEVHDKEGKPTDKVHTYNKKWSQWVEEGKAEKVW